MLALQIVLANRCKHFLCQIEPKTQFEITAKPCCNVGATNPSTPNEDFAVTSYLTSSLARVASKLQSDPEQTLIFERFLPAEEVREVCKELGHLFRNRVYTPVVTAWMFIGQALSKDHSCRDAVHRLNSWRVANGKSKINSNTSAYCEARQRLPEEVVRELALRSGRKCQNQIGNRWSCKGRNGKVIDGTTLTMQDTPENQSEYPQPSGQKAGCGFPILRCVLMFCLASGAALDISSAPYEGKKTGENSLLRLLLDLILPGDILLGDRYYASYWNLEHACRNGYDAIFRAHHTRKIDLRRGTKQGPGDQIVVYQRPDRRPVWMSPDEYSECDPILLVRHVRFQVAVEGFRAKWITIATTLLYANQYSVDDLAEIYRRRWEVELDIRCLKTHMQMDHLRCKTPGMARKEIYAHLIAYNLIRHLIGMTAIRYGKPPAVFSHMGAIQALTAFADQLNVGCVRLGPLEDALLESISEHSVGDRSPRSHPREIKRRPKHYKLMNKPRHAARKAA